MPSASTLGQPFAIGVFLLAMSALVLIDARPHGYPGPFAGEIEAVAEGRDIPEFEPCLLYTFSLPLAGYMLSLFGAGFHGAPIPVLKEALPDDTPEGR